MIGAREKVASWEDTFLAIAQTVKLRSKDPMTQTGAVIVSEDHRVLSLGYNGMPNGIDDADVPWERGDPEGDPCSSKYSFVLHAEENAILNYRGSLREFRGSTAYTTHFPCSGCARQLIQVGIRRVVYAKPYRSVIGKVAASLRMLELAGVVVEQAASDAKAPTSSPASPSPMKRRAEQIVARVLLRNPVSPECDVVADLRANGLLADEEPRATVGGAADV